MPVAVRTVDPDLSAPWTFEAWANGSDPMLDAVQELARQAR